MFPLFQLHQSARRKKQTENEENAKAQTLSKSRKRKIWKEEEEEVFNNAIEKYGVNDVDSVLKEFKEHKQVTTKQVRTKLNNYKTKKKRESSPQEIVEIMVESSNDDM